MSRARQRIYHATLGFSFFAGFVSQVSRDTDTRISRPFKLITFSQARLGQHFRYVVHVLDTRHLDRPGIIASTAVEADDGLVLFDTGPESTFANIAEQLQEAGFAAKVSATGGGQYTVTLNPSPQTAVGQSLAIIKSVGADLPIKIELVP